MPTDRRRQPRIRGDFPAIVRGRTARGQRFEQRTQVCNLSTMGLHLRPLQDIAPGMKLFIVFRLSLTWAAPGLTVAAQGMVRRVEPGPVPPLDAPVGSGAFWGDDVANSIPQPAISVALAYD